MRPSLAITLDRDDTMLTTAAALIIQGVLLGGLYALFALGLSLSVGIVRFVNIAHGDFIVLASYLLLVFTTALGVNIIVALALIIPLGFAGGYILQRFLLMRLAGKSALLPLLVTFGLAIIVQNGLLEAFGADTHALNNVTLETSSIAIGGIHIGVLPVLTFLVAVALVLLLDLVLYRSRLGASIRAVSEDVATANLIGLSSPRISAIAMGMVGVTVVIAAWFMGLQMNFDPTAGPSRLLTAFEAVVLGGLGSLWGTLAGGVVLGLAQSVAGQYDAGWQLLAGHLTFLAIFLLRPEGLFPKY